MGLFNQQRHTSPNVFKVIALPDSPIPNAVYYVLKSDHVEEWVTDVKGTAYQVKFDVSGGGGGGGGDVTLSIAASVSLAKGQPVFVNNQSKLALANAAQFNTSAVIGLVAASAAINTPCSVECTQLTMSDWTGISDGASLVPGGTYFLGSSAGRITINPPNTVGQCVCVIGKAIGTTTLLLDISDPIQL